MSKVKKSGKIAPEQFKENESKPVLERVLTFEEYNQDLKTRLEEEHKSKLIKYEELIKIAPEFAVWLKTIIRYCNVDLHVLIFWNLKEDYGNHFNCVFYTNEHEYSIYGYTPNEKNPKGYLGCGASTRKPRPGEIWSRSNDLPDGKYTKETFDTIVRGIVAYELKNLQLWRTS